MAEYNGNDIYLNVEGVDVTARWREFTLALKIGDEDVSAGTGEWEKHAPKLMSTTAKMTLIYDDTQAATDQTALWEADAVIAVIYGPEGNAAGKPCHHQNYKVNGIKGPSTGHNKPAVVWEFDLISTGTPTKNIYAGDTFS